MNNGRDSIDEERYTGNTQGEDQGKNAGMEEMNNGMQVSTFRENRDSTKNSQKNVEAPVPVTVEDPLIRSTNHSQLVA